MMALLALFLLVSCEKEDTYGIPSPLDEALEGALLEQAAGRGLGYYRLLSEYHMTVLDDIKLSLKS